MTSNTLRQACTTALTLAAFTLPAWAQDAAPADADTPPATPIASGDSVTGELALGDATLEDGSYADNYVMQTEAGMVYTITLDSNEFDAFIQVLDADANPLKAADDRSPGDTNTTLIIFSPVPTTWTVQANSFSPGETGAYSMAVSSEPATIHQPGQAIEGVLDEEDELLADESRYETFFFELEANQAYLVQLSSGEFDTFMAVLDSTGDPIADNDDAPSGGTDSEVSFAPREDGVYQILVNGFDADSLGRYTLTVEPINANSN